MWTAPERGLNSRGQAMRRAGQPLQCGAAAGVGSSETCVRIEAAVPERSRWSAPASLPSSHIVASMPAAACSGPT